MPNCSNAYSISTYKPVPDDWTYESNAQIARVAEAAGFDFLFPVAKWKGYGGKTDFLGTSLETMTWAGALLATTERIQVFSTVHVPIVGGSARVGCAPVRLGLYRSAVVGSVRRADCRFSRARRATRT